MERRKVRELVSFVRGVSYKKDQAEKEAKPGYTVILRANNINNGRFQYDELVYVPSTLIKNEQIINKDDIVITMSSGSKAHVGKVAIAKEGTSMSFGAFCAKIIPERIYPQYLFYAFMNGAFRRHIEAASKGTNINNLKQEYILDYEVQLPSIEEQKHIVAYIEELFSQLDSGVETLKKTKQQLEVYRQAVLKEAYKNVKCFEKKTFGDLLCQMRNGYGIKPSNTGEYKILKISAVRPMKINFSEHRYNETVLPEEDTIKTNDLLFTRYNGSLEYVGVCARVPHLNDTYAVPDKIIRCVLKDSSNVHAKYLQYYMNQGDARQYILSKVKTTSGQKGIAGSDIKKAVVYIPPIEVQDRIVSEIENKLSACDNIEKTIETALQQAEGMRQSILQQAYRG